MQIIIVISMIFALFIALFAIQNASIITINLFWYEINLSQALVILGSALIGILIMLPFDIARRIKNRIRINELNNKIKKLNEELVQLRNNKDKTDEDYEIQNNNAKIEERIM